MKREDYIKAHELMEEIEAIKEEYEKWKRCLQWSTMQQVVFGFDYEENQDVELDTESINFEWLRGMIMHSLEIKIKDLQEKFESL